MPQRTPPTPHTHPQSLDTGSTPEAFAKREVELGTGYLSDTDHGSMSSNITVYSLAKKNGLTPILGFEGYVRDPNDPILLANGVPQVDGDFANYLKYTHFTCHFLDQTAYEMGAKLLSRAPLEKHGSEEKPLFNWANLEELGSTNTTFGSGCLIGLVARHLMVGRPDLAVQYYERYRSIVKPGNFIAEIFPHRCTHNWAHGVFVTTATQTHKFYPGKNLKTDGAVEISAQQLSKEFEGGKHTKLLGIYNNKILAELEEDLVSAEFVEDFVQNECSVDNPTGDIQLTANRFMMEQARKHGDPMVWSDDSHVATPEAKIIQDVRLAQSGNWKFHTSYHRQSGDELQLYAKEVLGLSDRDYESMVDNAFAWAERFKGFSLDYKPSLPGKFYPENTLAYTFEIINDVGRMDWNDPVYTARLKKEIDMIHRNGTVDLLSYFFPVQDVIAEYNREGFIVSPGRGSSAGLLLSYVMGLTAPDPVAEGLSMERFITLDRILNKKLPDFDLDLPHKTYLIGEVEEYVDVVLFDDQFSYTKKFRSEEVLSTTQGKLTIHAAIKYEASVFCEEGLLNPRTITRTYKERTHGYFDRRFPGHYAQIATIMTLKLKSAILDVARFTYGRGNIPYAIQALSKALPATPQGISDYKFVFGYEDSGKEVVGIIHTDPALQEYVRKYPDQWKLVQDALALPKTAGKHASAYVITGRPIEGYIPTIERDGMIVTQFEAKAIEAVGGVKYDFLLVKNLNIVQQAIALIQDRCGREVPKGFKTKLGNSPKCNLVPIGDTFFDVWALPKDQAVFTDICLGKTETVFQLDTSGVVKWLKYYEETKADGSYIIDSIRELAVFTALDRPGTLKAKLESPEGDIHNVLVEYVRRCLGKERSPTVLKVFDELFPKTQGLLIFQEDLQYAYQYLTGSTGAEAEAFRGYVGKKDKEKIMAAYPEFIRRAGIKLGSEELAQQVWEGINTFSDYAFCLAHAYSYMLVAYACAYLKHYFPLEWWAAVLTVNVKNTDKIAKKFWTFINDFAQLPDIANPVTKFEIQDGKIRFPLEFLHGVGEGAQAQIVKYAPYADLTDFCQKIEKHKDIYAKKEQVTKTIKKTGLTVTEIKTKRGLSAINSGTAYAMIVAGAMDSFFPAEWTLVEKLGEFERVYAETQGKKKVEPVKAEYLNLTAYQEFVLKKGILPVWGKNLVDVMVDCGHPLISTTYGKPEFKVEGQMGKWGPMRPSWVPVLTLDAFKDAQESNLNIPKGGYKVALAGMVHETRNWTYGENKESEACEVNLEVEGEIHKFVMWPNRDTGRLDKRFNATLEGSLAILVLNRYRNDKPFAIQDITIVEPAKVKVKKK